jgi:hypothetical protein
MYVFGRDARASMDPGPAFRFEKANLSRQELGDPVARLVEVER